MSTKAFILIETKANKRNEVVTTLRQTEGVKTADSVTGPYDVIAVVEGERLDEIGNIVNLIADTPTEKLENLEKVLKQANKLVAKAPTELLDFLSSLKED